ncbi:peptidylprolyl isomerase [Alterisphingorhabdus coralli]|uniref:Peptidylprolyl isomerase n=1 Tax=Alterisphingorhabdus coralli TaxID=3071408 RepID=A0AA97I0Y1_9SPHN|nr:peptidylprolyl isomerase [Parasphingorhabdus sp. SCSIO 66989]WOE74685.1 peptidylprolyl isomerase [Parasphingorhabdus sp. SCSIO 66989]
MNLRNLAREPLVHFVILGAVLYIALTWGGTPPDPASRVIKVGASEKEKIAESWTLTMGRSPTDAELDKAIDAYVREEVLYREALRLGLDESDTIVRRRMVSKMDLSASLAAETAEPSEEMLRAFFKENSELYADYGAANSKVSFDQSFFSSEAKAKAALSSGADTGEATSLAGTIEETAMRDIEARFGKGFTIGLNALEPGENWQGPLRSGFGWHLVRLRERVVQPPEFEALRDVLANDWRSAQIKARKERAYEVLSSAYRIDIDR